MAFASPGKASPNTSPEKILRDLRLVEPAFLDGAEVEAARVGFARQEGFGPEDEREDPEPVPPRRLVRREQAFVAARQVQHGGQIDLEELLRDGARAPHQ